MRMINILYFTIFFFSQQIIGKDIQISNSKIFNSETLEFSSTADLIISGDKIKESELLETLRERYGEGQVNINEGTFTPSTGLVE